MSNPIEQICHIYFYFYMFYFSFAQLFQYSYPSRAFLKRRWRPRFAAEPGLPNDIHLSLWRVPYASKK